MRRLALLWRFFVPHCLQFDHRPTHTATQSGGRVVPHEPQRTHDDKFCSCVRPGFRTRGAGVELSINSSATPRVEYESS